MAGEKGNWETFPGAAKLLLTVLRLSPILHKPYFSGIANIYIKKLILL